MLRDATEADMFDFRRTVSLDDLSDFEGGVPLSSINKPYQVEWNDDLFPTKSIISQCILTSNEMCVQAFNQTNPNNYSPPPVDLFVVSVILLMYSFFFVLFRHYKFTNACDKTHFGEVNQESLSEFKMKKFLGFEDKISAMVMSERSLIFYEENMESWYRRQQHWRQKSDTSITIIALNLAGILVSHFQMLPIIFLAISLLVSIPSLHKRVGTFSADDILILTLGCITSFYPFGALFLSYSGATINPHLILAFVVTSHFLTMFTSSLIWVFKALVCLISYFVYVLTLKIVNNQKTCLGETDPDKYPVVNLLLTLEHYRNKMVSGEPSDANTTTAITKNHNAAAKQLTQIDLLRSAQACDDEFNDQFFTTNIIIATFAFLGCVYAGYQTEFNSRGDFLKKYRLSSARVENENKLEQMQRELKLKELSPEQLNLVRDVMKDSDKSVQERGGRRNSIGTTTLARLEIKHEQIKMVKSNIGRGAFGDVHRAKWNGVEVAIKQLTSIEKEAMLSFRAEVLLMSQLRHPNIITLMGALWGEKMVGIVLEFASGGALDDALKTTKITKDWTWKDPKLRIITDIAQGMSYLHNTTYFDEKLNQQVTSVLHRDLKPGNVLLTTSFTAKVADFGASKALTASSEMTMTGTPIYMAPEVVLGEKYGKPADVYSFAVLMFALTCEKGNAYEAFVSTVGNEDMNSSSFRGFESEITSRPLSSNAIMSKVANEDIRPELNTNIKSLKALVKKSWCFQPNSRPNFDQLLTALETRVKPEIYSAADRTLKLRQVSERGVFLCFFFCTSTTKLTLPFVCCCCCC